MIELAPVPAGLSASLAVAATLPVSGAASIDFTTLLSGLGSAEPGHPERGVLPPPPDSEATPAAPSLGKAPARDAKALVPAEVTPTEVGLPVMAVAADAAPTRIVSSATPSSLGANLVTDAPQPPADKAIVLPDRATPAGANKRAHNEACDTSRAVQRASPPSPDFAEPVDAPADPDPKTYRGPHVEAGPADNAHPEVALARPAPQTLAIPTAVAPVASTSASIDEPSPDVADQALRDPGSDAGEPDGKDVGTSPTVVVAVPTTADVVTSAPVAPSLASTAPQSPPAATTATPVTQAASTATPASGQRREPVASIAEPRPGFDQALAAQAVTTKQTAPIEPSASPRADSAPMERPIAARDDAPALPSAATFDTVASSIQPPAGPTVGWITDAQLPVHRPLAPVVHLASALRDAVLLPPSDPGALPPPQTLALSTITTELGMVALDVARRDEQISVVFTTDNDAARAALTDAQPRLAADARAMGMVLTQSRVDDAPQRERRGGRGQSRRIDLDAPTSSARTTASADRYA